MAWETLAPVSAAAVISAAYHNQVRENIEHLAGMQFAGVALSALAAGTSAARIAVGSYTGNGSDNRQITGIGFTPKLVMVRINQNGYGEKLTYRFSLAGDLSWTDITGLAVANAIQSLDSDGFTVGTATHVNYNGLSYHYLAIG